MERMIELISDIKPLLKSSLPLVIQRLDTMERDGTFRMLKSALEVHSKIAGTYTAEDIDRIGDGVVALLGIIKRMGDPKVTALVHSAIDLMTGVDENDAQKTGPCNRLSAGFFDREVLIKGDNE